MNTFTIKLGSFIALIALTIPTGAQAYRFVESSSVQITDTTYLLTHTYNSGDRDSGKPAPNSGGLASVTNSGGLASVKLLPP